MSAEQAKAAIEKMKTDEDFRERIMALTEVAARLEIVRAEGFDCSAEEIAAVSGAPVHPDQAGVMEGIIIGGYRGGNPEAALFC